MPFFGPSFHESVRDKKLSQRQEALDKALGILAEIPVNPEEDVIIATPAHELADKIKSKQWSASTVVAAYARQCVAAHDELNCLTEGILILLPICPLTL